MKRKSMRRFVLLCAALIMLYASMTVSAKTTYKMGSKTKTYKGSFYTMYYNDKVVTDKKRPALMINSNIMIPYERALVKKGPKMKASFKSSSKRLTLTHESTVIKMYANKKYMYVNGKKKSLNTAPLYATVNGKKYLYVPAKALCKAFDLNYLYVKSEKAVYIDNEVAEIPVDNGSAPAPTTNAVIDSTITAKSFTDMTTSQFIKVMGPIAQADYQRTGVLASVTLAQAINESGWGKSGLAQKSNNMFGMKTSLSGNTWEGSVWDGSYVTVETKEEVKGKKVTTTAKFRKYANVALSVADHSAYLSNAMDGSSKRYKGLTSTTSYSKQLKILQSGGYCTWSGYVDELTSLIKKYDLTKYDVK